MSKKPWLFDPDNVAELEDLAHAGDMAENDWSDWKSYFGSGDASFEDQSPLRKSGYRRSREDVLRRHHRSRRERSHREL